MSQVGGRLAPQPLSILTSLALCSGSWSMCNTQQGQGDASSVRASLVLWTHSLGKAPHTPGTSSPGLQTSLPQATLRGLYLCPLAHGGHTELSCSISHLCHSSLAFKAQVIPGSLPWPPSGVPSSEPHASGHMQTKAGKDREKDLTSALHLTEGAGARAQR